MIPAKTAPIIGPAKYIQRLVNSCAAMAGPKLLAGLIPAPIKTNNKTAINSAADAFMFAIFFNFLFHKKKGSQNSPLLHIKLSD